MATIIGKDTDSAPPPPALPDLPNMDQVLQMVDSDNPENWYRLATWFDQVKQTFGEIEGGFRREAKTLETLWQGHSAGAYGGQVEQVSGLIEKVRQGPDYAGLLRRAGDALGVAQQRMRDLQAQRSEQPDTDPAVFDQQARQILTDLATVYGDVGG